MSKTVAPPKTGLSWAVDIPPDVARSMGIAEGSIAVLHPENGNIEVEILPPPSAELKESVRRICEEYRETFEELKRLGD